MPDLGELTTVPVTDIWTHEASEFTPGCEHLQLLGTAVGLDLEAVEREAEAGAFQVDILARDIGSGRTVVIENQLRPTDHGHLGKLLTYAAWYEADIAIWVASEFREEHQRALQHLNLRTDAATAFYGVEVTVASTTRAQRCSSASSLAPAARTRTCRHPKAAYPLPPRPACAPSGVSSRSSPTPCASSTASPMPPTPDPSTGARSERRAGLQV